MAYGRRTLRANSFSRVRSRTAKTARGDMGSYDTVNSTVVPSETLDPSSILVGKENFILQFDATLASPSGDTSSTPFLSLLRQVHTTLSGRMGGSPNISRTCSPFRRGLSTEYLLPRTGWTLFAEIKIVGQLVGVERKVWSCRTDTPLMHDRVVNVKA